MKTRILQIAFLSCLTFYATEALATTITFDDVPSGTNINSQYTALGVTFSAVSAPSANAYATTTLIVGHANGVSVFPNFSFFAAESGAVKAQFSTLQSSVSIDARMAEGIEKPEFDPDPRKAFLEAFDVSNNLIGAVVYYPYTWPTPGVWDNTHDAPWVTLTVMAPSASISYVLVSSQANPAGVGIGTGVFGEFDNLTFGAAAPTPEPTTALITVAGLVILIARRRCTVAL